MFNLKKSIKQILIDQAQQAIEQAQQNYTSTKQLTQSSDFKAESKWDTRSTEAGYLAVAQQQRLEELKQELRLVEEIDPIALRPNDPITLGALLEVKHNNLTRFYFLSSTAGGKIIEVDKQTILIISVFSPLGREFLGLQAGDTCEVEHANQIKEYEILTVY